MLQFIYVAYCALFKRLKCVYLKYQYVFYVKSKIVSSYVRKKIANTQVRRPSAIVCLPFLAYTISSHRRKYPVKSESWGVFIAL